MEFKNVGHLPASQVKLRLELIANDNGDWSPQAIDDKELRPAGVFPIGISVPIGTHAIGVPQPWKKYLYAWGRVTYVDGFGNERFTNFCHRYNTEVRETPSGGGYVIRKEYGPVTTNAGTTKIRGRVPCFPDASQADLREADRAKMPVFCGFL